MLEITQNSEPVAIDALQPIYVIFTNDGYLLARSPKCSANSYVIGATTEHRYRLRSVGVAGGCDEPLQSQSVAISKALLETREYELQDDNLILRGKEVEIVLTNLGPLIPGTNTVLAENRWRLVEANDHGEMIALDAVSPIYFTFDVAGLLNIFADCLAATYKIAAPSDRRYELTQSMFAATDCGETVNKQFNRVHNALNATTEYTIQDNQLFLTGDNVRIVLEIDNAQ
jgi:heat shock protein HslJ